MKCNIPKKFQDKKKKSDQFVIVRDLKVVIEKEYKCFSFARKKDIRNKIISLDGKSL